MSLEFTAERSMTQEFVDAATEKSVTLLREDFQTTRPLKAAQ